jgi:hypothetical protein
MDGLKPGRIVYYVFSEQAATEVMRRRTTGGAIAERIEQQAWPLGAQAHIGNPVSIGTIAPAMVVATFDSDAVNLKVMLDGSDVYWATSAPYDETKRPGSWHWMFEGQQTRYQPDRIEPSAKEKVT